MSVLTGLDRWRMRWERAGMATIPLWPNTKKPYAEAWNVTPPTMQWQDANARAGGHWRGNIGVMPGPDRLVLDADSPESADVIDRGLQGLGLRPPAETTPRGGTHFYLRVAKVPGDFDAMTLSSNVGEGEVRTRRANVVVACSSIDGRPYCMARGWVEDIATLPIVTWNDLTWLVAPGQLMAMEKLTEPPVRLVRRDIPARGIYLLRWLRTAYRDKWTPDLERYESRHAVEAAVVANLILAGWSHVEIEQAFEAWEPRHYMQYRPVQREKYLSRTYRNVLTWLASTPERTAIAETYRAAATDMAAWKGRGGMLERATYLGLLSICWQFNSWTVNAAELDLAGHGAASQGGANGALKRLERAGLVRRARRYRPFSQPFTPTTWTAFPYQPLYPPLL